MARHLKVDDDGTVVMTGIFNGNINLGGGVLTSKGAFDAFLATYSPGGLFRWGATFGGAGLDVEGDAVKRATPVKARRWSFGKLGGDFDRLRITEKPDRPLG